jgi:hypothetical protein
MWNGEWTPLRESAFPIPPFPICTRSASLNRLRQLRLDKSIETAAVLRL